MKKTKEKERERGLTAKDWLEGIIFIVFLAIVLAAIFAGSYFFK